MLSRRAMHMGCGWVAGGEGIAWVPKVKDGEASRKHAAVRTGHAECCGMNATRRDGLERVRADSTE